MIRIGRVFVGGCGRGGDGGRGAVAHYESHPALNQGSEILLEVEAGRCAKLARLGGRYLEEGTAGCGDASESG